MKPFKYIMLVQLVLFIGCINTDRSAWTVMDMWYNAPKDNQLQPWDWDEKKFYVVKPGSQEEAQFQLSENPIVQIPISQANNYSEHQLIKRNKESYYLVRGVFLNEGTGKFSIYSKGKQLWVYHGSLGRSAVPMKRRALIVSLDQMPEEVFVTCMMDE